jgi:putative CocE/NonD family hydrolase
LLEPVAESVTCFQRLSDGVQLAATVWRPVGTGPFPVLLMRQPYGRTIASTIVLAHPAWYAAHGYIVVIQDVRGTGDSGGDFNVFENEPRDGAEAVEWAATLPGSSGVVGMYGFSYQGITQLFALSQAPPSLKAIAPAMSAWTVRTDWAYENGAYRLAMNVAWSIQLGAIAAKRRGDAEAFAALKRLAGAMPLDGPVPARPQGLAALGATQPHFDWIANPDDGAYWQTRTPAHRFADRPTPAIPVFHIGGWYDLMLTGTLGAFRHFDAPHHHLLIGPWAHIPWNTLIGSVDMGPEAASPVDEASILFFDRHLKGHDEPAPARVRLFDLGTRSWWQGNAMPEARPTPFFLTTKGNAAVRPDEGGLNLKPGGAGGVDWFVHDPWQPAPSGGGHASLTPAIRDRAQIDIRNDVATYTSAPLEAPLTIAGDVSLEIYVESGAADFDIDAVLSWIEADGRVLNIVEAHARVGAAKALPLRLPMRTTLITIPAGRSLRLSVAGAAFPAFPINPGTGTLATDATGAECTPIAIAIRSGSVTPSAIWLPIAVDPPAQG